MMAKLKAMIMRDPAAALATVTEPLAEVRARREALLEQRAIAEAAPRVLAEAEADIDRFIALGAGHVEVPAGYLTRRASGYVDAFNVLERDPHATGIRLLCAIAPTAVKTWMGEALRERYRELPEPMTADQRQGELARLDAEIAEVERQEVELTWQLLGAGVDVEWRQDVDVALALGLEPTPEPAP
jgi:hypothetical protein